MPRAGAQRIGLVGNGIRHLLLELDLGTEPVTGSVGAEGGEPLGFTGYAGLIAALQTIRADDVGVLTPQEDPS